MQRPQGTSEDQQWAVGPKHREAGTRPAQGFVPGGTGGGEAGERHDLIYTFESSRWAHAGCRWTKEEAGRPGKMLCSLGERGRERAAAWSREVEGRERAAEGVRIYYTEEETGFAGRFDAEGRAGMVSLSLARYPERRSSYSICRSQNEKVGALVQKVLGIAGRGGTAEARGPHERGPHGWHKSQAREASPV